MSTMIFLIAAFAFLYVAEPALKVSIFYETLCPDSVYFIARQLYPDYSHFAQLIEVDFVPYGKATQYYNGTWDFLCQHGEQECHGNKYHACALHQTSTQLQKVQFVYCSMNDQNPALNTTLRACALNATLSWTDAVECYDTIGGELLSGYGNKTGTIPLTFVPTIVFNDDFNQGKSDEAFRNFYRTVCTTLAEGDRPEVCSILLPPPGSSRAVNLKPFWRVW